MSKLAIIWCAALFGSAVNASALDPLNILKNKVELASDTSILEANQILQTNQYIKVKKILREKFYAFRDKEYNERVVALNKVKNDVVNIREALPASHLLCPMQDVIIRLNLFYNAMNTTDECIIKKANATLEDIESDLKLNRFESDVQMCLQYHRVIPTFFNLMGAFVDVKRCLN